MNRNQTTQLNNIASQNHDSNTQLQWEIVKTERSSEK